MLTELHIENLGVIERVELTLGGGLTAVTGETGAGKTMLVEAIELLVGGRADSSMVRHGAAEARIDGRFVTADGDERVLTRVIPADGRSRAYVDGRLATVASLAEVAADIVDLHGQHAHQSLLSTATQRSALDEFGGVDLGPLRAAAGAAHRDRRRAGSARRRRASPSREIDLLRFQVDELDAAAVDDADEDTALDTEETRAGRRDRASRSSGGSGRRTRDDDGERDDSSGERRSARSTDGRPFAEHASRLRDLLAELDDVVADIRSDGESIEEAPERLAEIRERRQLLKNLRRKYGDDLAVGDGVPRRGGRPTPRARALRPASRASSTSSARWHWPSSGPQPRPSADGVARRARSSRRPSKPNCIGWPCRMLRSPSRSAITPTITPATGCSSCWRPIPGHLCCR